MKSNWFQRYLLPGFVFQSVIIAGGYGTGRELVEFFMAYGPLGGLLSMVFVTTAIWSVVNVASFEFARVLRVFDYRTFFQKLLGPGWILFETAYILLMLIVLAVIGATAGTMLQDGTGLPYAAGTLGMMAAVGLLVCLGSGSIERLLAGWSFLLYAVYIVMFVWAFATFGGDIRAVLATGEIKPGWWIGGVQYAGYSLAVIASVLFTLRHATSRRDTVIAGILAGPIAIIPAVLFYVAMVGQYPAVLDRAVPVTFLLELIGSNTLSVIFGIALFGTLIETGTAMIHAVNERLARGFEEKGRELPRSMRAVTAVALLAFAALMARVGLIDLIARGYGAMAWVFLANAYCRKCEQEREFKRYATKQQRQSWTCQGCGHHIHPTAGTIFHKSSTSLHLWFYAMYLMTSTRCGISAKQLERELGVTYKTAWRMFKKIRAELMDQDEEPLSGQVEADETYVGGKLRGPRRRWRSGMKDHKIPVFGAVERGGRVYATVVPSTLKPTLQGKIQERVLPASTVYTDELKAYKGLEKKGYPHKRINHSQNVYVVGEVHTNTIEGFWSLVKRGIGGVYHSVSAKHLQSYLNEYVWRYNQQVSGRNRFRALLLRAVR